MPSPKPRIYRVDYVGGHPPRRSTVVTKVPYGGAYAMTELLTRMVTVEELRWFRVSRATPAEIAAHRETMQRWLPALTTNTEVDWTL